MNVKRYIGKDMAECMELIRDELGPDAFILNQRSIRKPGVKGFFAKPLVEVVAAFEPNGKPSDRTAQEPEVPPVRSSVRYTLADAPPDVHVRYDDEPDDTEQSKAAALSALERIARLTAEPDKPKTTDSVIPSAPSAISAYAPHTVRLHKPEAARSSAESAEGGFTPLAMPRIELAAQPADPPPARAILPLVTQETALPAVNDNQKIHTIETKLDALSTTLSALVNKMQLDKTARGSYPAAVEELLLSLMENDVHEEFAHKIAREVAEIVHRQGAEALDVMEQVVRQTIGEASPIKLKRFKRHVVMLVGPTGVGKTTTLAKLAAIYQLNHHAKVGVITTDTFRIAAVQQLKTYAEILEIPLSIVYTPSDVADALREFEGMDLVLIDTAGRSPNDSTLEKEVTELIKRSDADEVYLVLSATTGFSGLLNIINTYSFLRDYKILFTKLDETFSWGMLLNTKFLTDRPISYMASGQTVPDDIEVMDPRKIVRRLLGQEK